MNNPISTVREQLITRAIPIWRNSGWLADFRKNIHNDAISSNLIDYLEIFDPDWDYDEFVGYLLIKVPHFQSRRKQFYEWLEKVWYINIIHKEDYMIKRFSTWIEASDNLVQEDIPNVKGMDQKLINRPWDFIDAIISVGIALRVEIGRWVIK